MHGHDGTEVAFVLASLSQKGGNNAAADALYRSGISHNRGNVVGLGKHYTLASNDSSAGQQKSRRFLVRISSQDGTGRRQTTMKCKKPMQYIVNLTVWRTL